MDKNIVLEKSFAFALRIAKLYRYLVEHKKEYVLSKELVIAGTNIGRHVKEAVYAESREVFVSEWRGQTEVGGHGILASALTV
ncbi:MAG TPA: four helix bundle protein [Pyrinomonadaceae bacterium]